MKKLFLLIIVFSFQMISAQVGINTTTPNAQLDIKSSNQASPSNTDGILIPKIDVFPTINPTAAQQGMLVYLTTASGSNQPGFYYWNNNTSSWIAIAASNSGWGLSGNSGTNASSNFIGTTDDADVVFKRNNIKSGSIQSFNTALGVNSLSNNSSGSINSALGTDSLKNNATGIGNTAVGYSSSRSNISGSDNTSIGNQSLDGNTFGSGNVALGSLSQLSNVSGNFNTAVGAESLRNNSVNSLTAVGYSSLRSNTTGTNNDAFGANALTNNTVGGSNSAFGESSLRNNISGGANVAFGSSSLLNNSNGSRNTALGYFSLKSNISGIDNVAVGSDALSVNTTGNGNVALGSLSQFSNSAGNFNTSVGFESLRNNTVSSNTAMGYFSMHNNSTGFSNSAFGLNALLNSQNGNLNSAFGENSLTNNTMGGGNAAFGNESLHSNSTGGFNTAIGYNSDVASGNLLNATAIGANAMVGASNSLVLGSISGVNSSFSNTNVGIGTTTPLDRLHVVGNIRMVDGNQAAGKVLTSDANGTAAWTTPSTSSGTLDQAYDSGGAGNGRTITADSGAVNISGPDGLVSIRTAVNGAVAPTGSGVRMVWNPRKAAFRAGQVLATEWDDATIGASSVAFGTATISSANQTSAFGFNTTASGNVATAFGSITTASGTIATSFGSSTIASGNVSSSFGDSNTASSYGETVLGIGATTYTVSTNGATQFRASNLADRLFTIGNAIDSNNNNLVDAAERSDAMVVLKDGSTGIGISRPLTRLDVRSFNVITNSDSQFGNLNVMTNDSQGINKGGAISLGGFNDNALLSSSVFGSIEGRKINGTSGSRNGYLSFKTNGGAVDGLSERMRITDFGFVGVGTITPLDRLHVVGNIRMVDGNQAAGKVLTSDANGTASWTLPGAATAGTLDQSYDFGGAGLGNTITADAGAVLINGTDGLVSTGTTTTGVLAPSGAGTRMVWNPRKAAFRAGTVIGTQWDDVNIGPFSVAFGSNTIARGNNSVAFGINNVASPASSVAFGEGNGAAGLNSTVFGFANTSSSFGETVFGIGATTYSPVNQTQFRTTNGTDRLFVIGNAIDVNNNGSVDTAERSDALVILKNGNTGIGSSTPQDKLHIVGNLRMVDGNQAAGKVLTSDVNGTATWQNASANAWGLSGNAGINDPAVPAVYGTSVIGATEDWCGTTDANDYVLGTNGIERLRIKQTTGNVGIGTSSPSRKLHVFTGSSGGTPNANADFVLESNGAIYQHFLAPAANETGILFGSDASSIRGGVLYNNATDLLQFRSGGNTNRMVITAAGDVGVGTAAPGGQFELSLNEGRKPASNTWTITSDARLKNVNGIYKKGLAEILQLKPIRYNYKNTDKRIFDPKVLSKEAYGFLAQEVQPLFPEAVGTDPDGYLNFDLHPILIASVNAFKELDAKNKELQAQNESLKAELEKLKEKVDFIMSEMQKR